jgi:Domain of unknown function (DUF4911)
MRALSQECDPLETLKKRFRVDRREIAFLRFILEAYDGIAVLETEEPKMGIVVLHIAPQCLAELALLLTDLKNDIMIEEIEHG